MQEKYFTLRQQMKHCSYREGKFTLASGKESDYYVDCKKTLLTGRGLRLASLAFIDVFRDLELPIHTIAGIGFGGAILAPAVALVTRNLNFNIALVRSAVKDHGTQVEVELPYGWTVDNDMCSVVVEDVTTTGGSALHAVTALQQLGVELIEVVTLLDRREGAKQLFEAHNIPFTAILTVDDLRSN